jgi:hypothetical protein
MPFSADRRVNITFGALAFFAISILLHTSGLSGEDILQFLLQPIVWVLDVLDDLVAFVCRLISVTPPFDLSNGFEILWERFVDYIINPLALGGVGEGAPYYFVVNLCLVIFYLLFRSILSLVVSVIQALWNRSKGMVIDDDDDVEDYEGIEPKENFELPGYNWWFDTPAVKRTTLILYRAGIFVLLACLLTSVWAAWADMNNTQLPDVVARFRDFAMSLYWAGLIILMGEIAAAVRVKSPFDRFMGWLNSDRKSVEKNSLAELFQTYKSELGAAAWLEALSYPPENEKPNPENGSDQTGASTGSNSDADSTIGSINVQDVAKRMANNRFSHLKVGVLTSADFAIMAELVKATKDSGGTTLIICPQSQNEDDRTDVTQYDDISVLVRENIKDAMGATVYDVTQNHYMLRQTDVTKDLDYSLLIGSEFEMADMLSRPTADSAHRALLQVRSIILIEFQRLDTGVLALQFQRLRRDAVHKQFAVFCQSDGRVGLEATLDNLFQDGDTEAFTKTTVVGDRHHFRYWLLWRHHKGLMDKLGAFSGLNGNSGDMVLNEAMPLLMLPTWSKKFSASIYDPLGRIFLPDWRGRWVDNLQRFAKKNLKSLKGALSAASPFGLFRARYIGQVIFQEDHINLFEVLQRYRNFEHTDDTMVHVVSSWYPVRDFMYETLNSSKPKGDDLRISEKFLPIQPLPSHGPKQVAISLYDALSQGEAVPERRVQAIMTRLSQDPAPKMLETLGATASKRGLEMLFNRVLGFNVNISRFVPKGAREASLSFGKANLRNDFYLARVTWKAGDVVRVIARVYAGDYGLTYSKDTYLQIGRTMFGVLNMVSINEPIKVDTEISVTRKDYHQLGFKARPAIQFCRNYRLLLEQDRLAGTPFSDEVKDFPAILIEKGEGNYPGPGATTLRLVHLSFERETFGRYMYEHNVPFGQSSKKDCQPVSDPHKLVQGQGFKIERVHQPALILSFVNTAAGVGKGGGPSRGKAAFTLAVTLNDLIATLFPREAHRLAIVSPQAELQHLQSRRQNAWADQAKLVQIDTYVELAYPQYIAPEVTGKNGGAGADWSRQFGDVFNDGRYRLDQTTATMSSDTTFSSKRIDLIALEDAGLDLGVARAMYENWANIETHWCAYLTWLSKAKGAANPYAFGGKDVPSQFDFEGALAWINSQK